MDRLYVFSFVNFFHGDWSQHTSPLQQATLQQLASCNMTVNCLLVTVGLQENEGCKETSKLMTPNDCNTDLALASNQFWPLWLLQSFKSLLLVFWRLLLRPAWVYANVHVCAEQKVEFMYRWSATWCCCGTRAHNEHVTQTHKDNKKSGNHFPVARLMLKFCHSKNHISLQWTF